MQVQFFHCLNAGLDRRHVVRRDEGVQFLRPLALSSSSEVTCRRVWEAPRTTVG